MRWRIDRGNSWVGECPPFRIRIDSGSGLMFVGFIYRLTSGALEFQLTYPSLESAKRDLIRRCTEEDFVPPEDAAFVADVTATVLTDTTLPEGAELSTNPEEPEIPRPHTVVLERSKEDGLYYWHRKAANGEIISHGEGYTDKRKARHGIRIANQDDNYRLIDRTEGNEE